MAVLGLGVRGRGRGGVRVPVRVSPNPKPKPKPKPKRVGAPAGWRASERRYGKVRGDIGRYGEIWGDITCRMACEREEVSLAEVEPEARKLGLGLG